MLSYFTFRVLLGLVLCVSASGTLIDASSPQFSCGTFPISLEEFKIAFPRASSSVVTENYNALVSAACELGETSSMFSSSLSKVIFLGSISHNTAQLSSHQAFCARNGGQCSSSYDAACDWLPNVSGEDGKHYHPRGALMLTYTCHYFGFNEYLKSKGVEYQDIMKEPALLSTDLRYSYLSAVYVWQFADKNNLSCRDYATDAASASKCMHLLNWWECTAQGQDEQTARLAQIRRVVNALGSPVDVSDAALETLRCSSNPRPQNETTPCPQHQQQQLKCSACANADTNIACGSISRHRFGQVFANTTSELVDANFAALRQACCTAEQQMDSFSASVFLGSINRNTNGLEAHRAVCARCNSQHSFQHSCSPHYDEACCWEPDVKPVAEQSYYGRGGMMLALPCNYHQLQRWIETKGCENVDDLLANPSKLDSNLLYSWLSSLYVWQAKDEREKSCSDYVSAGTFSLCLENLNVRECTEAGWAEQWQRLFAIQESALVFGLDLTDSHLKAMACVRPDTFSTCPCSSNDASQSSSVPQSWSASQSSAASQSTSPPQSTSAPQSTAAPFDTYSNTEEDSNTTLQKAAASSTTPYHASLLMLPLCAALAVFL